MTAKQDARIMEARRIAMEYGMIDGAHHKQWVIDQMLRVLLGNDKGYQEFLREMNVEGYDPWDTGVAP